MSFRWWLDLINSFSLTQLKSAIRKGVDRLKRHIKDKRWHGIPTLAGESDIWVTGFTLAHILDLTIHDPIVEEVQSYLISSRKSSGGWSYNEEVPCDADSTAWCLMALEGAKGFTDKEREIAKAFMWSHRTHHGISTYRKDSGILKYLEIDQGHRIVGWTSAHPDVTAAVLLAGGVKKKQENEELAELVATQKGSGFFDAYWWRGPHYTTTLLLRILTNNKKRLTDSQAYLLLNALRREQLSDGGFGLGSSLQLDPFTTALALESLSYLFYLGGDSIRRLAGLSLMKSQKDDGSWEGNYIMRIPAPNIVDPQHVSKWSREGFGGNCYISDTNGLFATAVSCFALEKWRRVESGEVDNVHMWPVVQPIEDRRENELRLRKMVPQ